MRRLLFILPVLGFAAVALALALGLTRNPQTLPSALIDQPMPQFALPPLLDGKPGLDTQAIRGQVALVNLFASWCAPCRVEHPLLMRLAEEKAVPIYGIAYKDRPEDARAWLASLGDPYSRIGADLDGRVAIDWGVYGVPETYVIDRNGRIRYRHVGALTPQDVQSVLRPMITELSR